MQTTRRPAVAFSPARLAQIAAVLPDETLVANLNSLAETFDRLAADKLDVDDPSLARDRALLDALRQEFRNRSGEVI